MDIKPASQKKKLVYPLAAAAVVGSAVLSSCDQQQQTQILEILDVEPPQPLGGLIGPKKSLPSEKKSPQGLSGVVMDEPAALLQVLRGVIMLEPAKGDAPVKADK